MFELWNSTPNDDLAGLSPNALTELLDDPFEATDVLVFAEVVSRAPDAPIATLLDPVFEALLAGPVRATAAGYLPPSLCATVMARVLERQGLTRDEEMASARITELHIPHLHLARSVAQYAGLMRRRAGAFHLTRAGRALYERRGMAAVLPVLLRAHATRLEWSSLDDWPRLGVLQASVGFSLLLVARYGQVERPAAFYAERWLRAFPRALEAFAGLGEGSDEAALEQFERCFEVRVIERFMVPFGLVTPDRRWSEGARPVLYVRASALFGDLFALRHGV